MDEKTKQAIVAAAGSGMVIDPLLASFGLSTSDTSDTAAMEPDREAVERKDTNRE